MIIEPTQKQIQCCNYMGWEYVGDGLFINNNHLGYFTEDGFRKE